MHGIMNIFTKEKTDKVQTIKSLEVADMESTYVTEQNKTMPCFDVTKKGCEFIANKLTRRKRCGIHREVYQSFSRYGGLY